MRSKEMEPEVGVKVEWEGAQGLEANVASGAAKYQQYSHCSLYQDRSRQSAGHISGWQSPLQGSAHLNHICAGC